MPRHVHLVGSVPGHDAAEVFESVSAALGTGSSASPMGKPANAATGSPGWSRCLPRAAPGKIRRGVPSASDRAAAHALPPQPGKTVADVRFENLFYADIAQQSYAAFKRLKAQGQGAEGRALPGRSGAGAFGAVALSAGRPACAGRSDLQRGGQARDRQARRDDPARRTGRFSSTWLQPCSRGWSAATSAPTAEAATKLRRRSPASWSISRSTCRSTSNCCSISATAIPTTSMWSSRPTWATWWTWRTGFRPAIGRPIELIHMPVPRDRSDDGYFAPLAKDCG